jgi:p38 MAP kinase
VEVDDEACFVFISPLNTNQTRHHRQDILDMAEHRFSSANTSSTQSRRSSAQYPVIAIRTKPSIGKRMKGWLFCGLKQQRSSSPPLSLTPRPTRKRITITTMAADSGDQEWYTAECGASQYTLPKRYQDLSPIGQGAFGAVIKAVDTVTGKDVAIKRMLKPFQSDTHAKRTYRELKLLVHLNHPDAQCVQLYDVFTPEKDLSNFQTLYFVLNYVDYDLSKVIKRGAAFTEEHIQLLVYSLLRGLKFIHSAGVIHRDLKPTNIGISRNSDLTILDFGLARVATAGLQTGYVATRWWRAPEVFINWERYDEKVDIWSVGCIMAELILLKPLFAGTDHIDQLSKIFDIVGIPDLATLNEVCEPYARDYIHKLPNKQKQDYKKLFGYKYIQGSKTPVSGISPQGIALLDRLLSFDHRTRPTAIEALSDPYFEHLHDPMEEPSCIPLTDDHQDATYTIARWKCKSSDSYSIQPYFSFNSKATIFACI